jgi:N-acyl-D-aspartate/D-glutamate deacylase
LIAIGRAMGRAGRGTFGFLSDFEDEATEWKWIRQVAKDSGRPVWFLLTDRSYDPDRWRRLMDGVRAGRADNLPLYAQVAGRPVGLTLGLGTSLNPFGLRQAFVEAARLPPAEMLAKLRTPEMRKLILSQEASPRLLEVLPPLSRQIATRWDRMYPLGETPDYEPPAERSIDALAAKEGVSPAEYCYDYLVGGDNRMVYFPVTNYVHGDLEVVRAMIEDPHTVLGLSDGGAHCGVICDASLNTTMLAHWVRDRSRGPRMPLEFVVQQMTSGTADFYGFKDRGRLQPGKKADVNVIDFEGLYLHSPKMIFDLPAGGRRLVQQVDGYDMTICAGTPIFEKGQETGARPGKLVRSTS